MTSKHELKIKIREVNDEETIRNANDIEAMAYCKIVFYELCQLKFRLCVDCPLSNEGRRCIDSVDYYTAKDILSNKEVILEVIKDEQT